MGHGHCGKQISQDHVKTDLVLQPMTYLEGKKD
jgi:hypothetical protein